MIFADVVLGLNAEIMRALRQPDVTERLRSLGFDAPATHGPAEFTTFVRQDSDKWQKVVKNAGIPAE